MAHKRVRTTLDISSRRRKGKKSDLPIQHLELLNYKLKLQALELERKLSLPRSEYTKDLPQTNTQVANNANLLIPQDGLVKNDTGCQNIAL
jgi:hypothetical protein